MPCTRTCSWESALLHNHRCPVRQHSCAFQHSRAAVSRGSNSRRSLRVCFWLQELASTGLDETSNKLSFAISSILSARCISFIACATSVLSVFISPLSGASCGLSRAAAGNLCALLASSCVVSKAKGSPQTGAATESSHSRSRCSFLLWHSHVVLQSRPVHRQKRHSFFRLCTSSCWCTRHNLKEFVCICRSSWIEHSQVSNRCWARTHPPGSKRCAWREGGSMER